MDIVDNSMTGLRTSEGGPIFQHFRKEGYVVDATGSHRAGYAASGKPMFVAVKEGPSHEKMLKNLFDPQMHISHQVSIYQHDCLPVLLMLFRSTNYRQNSTRNL